MYRVQSRVLKPQRLKNVVYGQNLDCPTLYFLLLRLRFLPPRLLPLPPGCPLLVPGFMLVVPVELSPVPSGGGAAAAGSGAAFSSAFTSTSSATVGWGGSGSITGTGISPLSPADRLFFCSLQRTTWHLLESMHGDHCRLTAHYGKLTLWQAHLCSLRLVSWRCLRMLVLAAGGGRLTEAHARRRGRRLLLLLLLMWFLRLHWLGRRRWCRRHVLGRGDNGRGLRICSRRVVGG